MSYAFGVDVSHWHPVVDWGQLITATCAGEPLSFFGAKATQGTTMVDQEFLRHRDGFRSACVGAPQLLLGVYYHYCGGGDPKAEAAHFMSTVGPLRHNERLVLDVEGDIPPAFNWVQEFVAQLPLRSFVYTSARIWTAMGNPAWPDATTGNVELWVPRYDSGDAEPKIPSPWTFWRFWQFSETFVCPGVANQCDASWFNGTAADLAKYVTG